MADTLIRDNKCGDITVEFALLELMNHFRIRTKQAMIEKLVFDAYDKEIEKK